MHHEFTRLGLIDEELIELDHAALFLAALDHEGADLQPYQALVAQIAARVAELGSATAAARACALSRVLADEFGFGGDSTTYDDPANADLIWVIDRRRGLPVSLSILYVAAARRVGWRADVLGVPGHVLVLIDGALVIDPFRGGITVEVAGALPGAMPNRAVLVRLLLNQASRAEAAGEGRRALVLFERMTVVAPDYPQGWWERARLELVDGDAAAARLSLSAMLEITREPGLRARVVALLGRITAD